MASLRTELRQMELRIGVVSHQVVNLSLRDKISKAELLQRDAPGSTKPA